MGWAYFLGSVMETVGSTLLSGNVIKKLVAGIINIQAYQSNRTEEMIKFEQGQAYLINENMLIIGMLKFFTVKFGISKHDTVKTARLKKPAMTSGGFFTQTCLRINYNIMPIYKDLLSPQYLDKCYCNDNMKSF
jgi:hypothetical protein